MPILSNHELSRDIRNARRVLWWKLILVVCYASLSTLGMSSSLHAVLLACFSVVILLFTYILFLAFSRIAKHFHAMPLFWFFVVDVIVGILLQSFDAIEQLLYYQVPDPHSTFTGGIAILTGAIMTFAYGYYIMKLPVRKFGNILFRARVLNIAQAFLMAFLVLFIAIPPTNSTSQLLFDIVGLGNLVMIVVSSAIDFIILGTALSLLKGVFPHNASQTQ